MLRKIIIYILVGVGFGGLIYVLSLLTAGAQTQTVGQIGNVVWISALIGLVTMIYELERPALLWQIILHFIAVYALVILMNILNKAASPSSLSFFLNFAMIYLVIWFVVYLTFYRRVSRINRKLQEKQENKT
ncbi:DUF3021 domain-containing protein [Streptococcus dentiloxodontae]